MSKTRRGGRKYQIRKIKRLHYNNQQTVRTNEIKCRVIENNVLEKEREVRVTNYKLKQFVYKITYPSIETIPVGDPRRGRYAQLAVSKGTPAKLSIVTDQNHGRRTCNK